MDYDSSQADASSRPLSEFNDKESALAQNISYINQKLNLPMSSVIQQLKRIQSNQSSEFINSHPTTIAPSIEPSIQLHAQFQNLNFFSSVNRSAPILDNNASKFKSSLIKRGSLATRHLPNQTKSKSESEEDQSNEELDEEDEGNVEELDSNDGDIENEDESINQFRNAKYKQFIDNYEVPMAFNLPNINSFSSVYSASSATTTTNLASSSAASSTSSGYNNVGNHPVAGNFVSNDPIDDWSCESVVRWLSHNDLSQYIDAFLDKQIDGDKLVELDSAKLKVNLIKHMKIYRLKRRYNYHSVQPGDKLQIIYKNMKICPFNLKYLGYNRVEFTLDYFDFI